MTAAAGYERIGEVDEFTVAFARDICGYADWQIIQGDGVNYRAWTGAEAYLEHVEGLLALWPRHRWKTAWYVVLPARTGHLQRHSDGDKHYQTYHLPLTTNPGAVCRMYEDGIPRDYHLQVGGVYRIDRAIEHESFNTGDTDRVHLLIDVLPDGSG